MDGVTCPFCCKVRRRQVFVLYAFVHCLRCNARATKNRDGWSWWPPVGIDLTKHYENWKRERELAAAADLSKR